MLQNANDYAELAENAVEASLRLDDEQLHDKAQVERQHAVIYAMLAVASAVADVDDSVRRLASER